MIIILSLKKYILKNIQNKRNLLFLILFITITLLQCAAHHREYLTSESRIIHETLGADHVNFYKFFMPTTKHQTPVFHFKSQADGPAILIIGGTHGNEPAGFEAAHRLLKQFTLSKLKKGEIFLIPEANKIAIIKYKRRIPVPLKINIEKGNLNRCYPGDSLGLPMEKMAFQITELMREQDIDLLLDLHESPVFHLEMKDNTTQYHGLGQTLIYTPDEKATWLGMVVLDNLNNALPPGIKQFSLVESPIKLSAAWCAGQHLNIPGFTLETCKKLPLEERIQYHIKIVNIMLSEMGMTSISNY